MSAHNQLTPAAKYISEITRVRRESLLRQLAFETKAQQTATTAKNWLNFGVFIAALSPAYYLCIKSWGYANPNRHFLSAAAASGGVVGFSLYYRWQSKRMLETSRKWQTVFEEATDATEKPTAPQEEIDALLEKHKAMKEAYRELGTFDLSWSSRYKENYPEHSHLFEVKK